MRSRLVTALISCADSSYRPQTRRFVQGLSSDELQFIAGFLGACVLDSVGGSCSSRAQWAERIASYQKSCICSRCGSADQEHKMILILEYLCQTGVSRVSIPASA